MTLADYVSRMKDWYSERKARKAEVDLDKRDTLGKLLTGAGILVTSGGLVALTSSLAHAYEERTLTDENTFKDEISKYNTAWVKYTFDGERPHIKKRGKKFWQRLKAEFGDQVDAYVTVNCTGWSNNLQRAEEEIGRKALPSFILYQYGKVVNDDTPKDIRLRGVRKEHEFYKSLNYIRQNCFLK